MTLFNKTSRTEFALALALILLASMFWDQFLSAQGVDLSANPYLIGGPWQPYDLLFLGLTVAVQVIVSVGRLRDMGMSPFMVLFGLGLDTASICLSMNPETMVQASAFFVASLLFNFALLIWPGRSKVPAHV
jgi:hypothetical protein